MARNNDKQKAKSRNPIAGEHRARAASPATGAAVEKGTIEAVDSTAEDAYWHRHWKTRPYIDEVGLDELDYRDFSEAYRTGYMGFAEYAGMGLSFEDVEEDLERSYDERRGDSALDWTKAREAAKDAWERMDNQSDSGTRDM